MDSEVKLAGQNEHAKLSLLIRRQLIALMAAVIYSAIVVYLFFKGHFRYDTEAFVYALLLFWLGNISMTLLIYKGISNRFSDPSMTLLQMFWP